MMDIKQLKNFVEIVDADFNISETSKKIHISQPALSKMIINFEREENVQLFERSYGRLQNLTPAGENFYYNAVELLKQYDEMMENLRHDAAKVKGRIRIGIPPLVLAVLFSEIIPKLILEYPNIQFEISEVGAFELKKSLVLQEIDIAILLNPADFNKASIEKVIIADDDLCAFMNEDNKLADNKKLQWSDLNNEDIAIFSESFMINHYLMRKFESKSVRPNIKIKSSSWDYLLYSTEANNLITILPSPISNFAYYKNLVKVEFYDPINWEVILCRYSKAHYSRVETLIYDELIDYFKTRNLHNTEKVHSL